MAEGRSASEVILRAYRGPRETHVLAEVARASLAADDLDWSVTDDEIAGNFEHPEGFRSDEDVVVAEAAGAVVGWAMPYRVRLSAGERWAFHWGLVLPEWRRKGIGTRLLHAVQDRIDARFAERGESGSYASQVDALLQRHEVRMLERDGYVWRRGSFTMRRDLAEPIDAAPLPAGVELRDVRPEHYRAVLEASDEALADLAIRAPDDEALRETRFERAMRDVTFQPDRWIVAWAGDEVAGSIRGWIDDEENERFGRRRGYTERIAVRRPWRGRGLASAMIVRHLELLRDAGMTESVLGVDTENPSGALRIYERLGFRRIGEDGVFVKPARRGA